MPRPTSVFKLFDAAEDRAVNSVGDPVVKIDGAAMTATATICTPAVDRDGEVILPAGIDVESRYRKNPVVLWDHGFSELFPLPIARCETEDGELDLDVSEDAMIGTAHFTNKDRLSEQIFHLIDDKVIRATSVRVDPDLAEVYSAVKDGVRAKVYPKSTLIEWSWGAMGVNPETVAVMRKAVSKKKIAGSPIHASLFKTMSTVVARHDSKRPTIVRGWTLENKTVSICKTCGKNVRGDLAKCSCQDSEHDGTENDLAKMAGVIGGFHGVGAGGGGGGGGGNMTTEDVVAGAGRAAGAALGSLFRSDSPNAPVDPTMGGMNGGDPGMQQQVNTAQTPSGRVLMAVRASVNELISNIEGSASAYENPDVRAYLATFVSELMAAGLQVDSLNSLHGMVRNEPLAAPPATRDSDAKRDPPPSDDEEDGDEETPPPKEEVGEEDSSDDEEKEKEKFKTIARLQQQINVNAQKLKSLQALGS